MPKVLTVIATLIVLAIAVEAGYFWGVKRSALFTVPEVNIVGQPTEEVPLTPTPFPTPFPASMIPGLLSYQAAIAIGQNSVEPKAWKSEWTIGQGGGLIALTENSISLDYPDSGRKNFVFPEGVPIEYFKWNESIQQSLPAEPGEFIPGDDIGITFTIETTSGNFKKVEIVKNVD